MSTELTKMKFLELINEKKLLGYKDKLVKLYMTNKTGWNYALSAPVTDMITETEPPMIYINNAFSNENKQYLLRDILNKLFYYPGDAPLAFEIYGTDKNGVNEQIICLVPLVEDVHFEVYGDTIAIKIKVQHHEFTGGSK